MSLIVNNPAFFSSNGNDSWSFELISSSLVISNLGNAAAKPSSVDASPAVPMIHLPVASQQGVFFGRSGFCDGAFNTIATALSASRRIAACRRNCCLLVPTEDFYTDLSIMIGDLKINKPHHARTESHLNIVHLPVSIGLVCS